MVSQGVLVVEPSATLSNLLVRTLRAGGYTLTSVTRDFTEALTLLKDAVERGKTYDAVILGVPPRVANPIKPLLKFVQPDGPVGKMPFILVIHDKHVVLERWAENRGHSAIVPWQRFSQIPSTMAEMISRPSKGAESEAEPDPAASACCL